MTAFASLSNSNSNTTRVEDVQHDLHAMKDRLDLIISTTGFKNMLVSRLSPGHIPKPTLNPGMCAIQGEPEGLALEYIGGTLGRSRIYVGNPAQGGLLAIGETYENILTAAKQLPHGLIVYMEIAMLYANAPFAHANIPIPFATRSSPWAHADDPRITNLMSIHVQGHNLHCLVLKICIEFSERCAYISWKDKQDQRICSREILWDHANGSAMNVATFSRIQATLFNIARENGLFTNSHTSSQFVFLLLDG